MKNLIFNTSTKAKFFFCITIIFLGLTACSKDDGGGSDASTSKDYYFKASLDGRKIDFRVVKFQGGGNDNRFEQIVVGGYETSFPTTSGATLPPSLDFEIWNLGGNITAGTYTTPSELVMIARYAIQTKNGTLLYNTSYSDDLFTVKIEKISKEEGIKGIFSGTVRNFEGAPISVTDGSFNLPYDKLINP
ncbi:hypothetical protein [Flavobacterium sp. FlaQc-47]|uniref:hypothetical protein n=1 Tax=Flavobacterium sp. FlaQc-47 TaxID=3374180 RepID=UPI0037568794